MHALVALWLPILVSAVAVFIVSSIIHMMSPWHKTDYSMVPNQDRVMDALRPFGIPPGDYMMPRPESMADMKSAEFKAKRAKGPVMIMTVMPSGAGEGMGKYLVSWFLYLVVVSAIAGSVASASIGVTPTDHRIFHFAAATAFASYAIALWQLSIWYHRSWSTTLKITFDGLIYAVLTGLIFVWMWPK